MDKKRRTLKKVASVSAVVALSPTSWTKPVLSSIVLPAHAQMSACSMAELAGQWEFSSQENSQSIFTIELFEDGSTDLMLGASWAILSNGIFSLFIDGGDVIYSSSSEATDCINLSGTITNFIGDNGEPVSGGIPAGNWFAQKL